MKVLSCLHMTIEYVFAYFSWSFFSAGYFCCGIFDTDTADMGILKTAESAFGGV